MVIEEASTSGTGAPSSIVVDSTLVTEVVLTSREVPAREHKTLELGVEQAFFFRSSNHLLGVVYKKGSESDLFKLHKH